MPRLDLEPAACAMTVLLDGVSDEQLLAATPCPKYSLGDLIDHVDGLSLAFVAAARKEKLPGDARGPNGDARRLGSEWRSRIPARLAELAEAWADPAAWEGTTEAGGREMPGELAGTIALDELVVHGWDVARATGQNFDCPHELIEACIGFVSVSADPAERAEDNGLFGPVVHVPANASPLEHLVGLAGRDPAWNGTR
ncbi:MAG: TIGR03086 family metal-binding protein [Actinomycetota bacterium]|nr:TIGR03086 family metal-binding protein [Actinomycetota bacterium]